MGDMHPKIMVISYGDFAVSKKLFSFECGGVHILPVFTEMDCATRFCREMELALQQRDCHLMVQCCVDPRKVVDILKIIMACTPDLVRVAINPDPPVVSDDHQAMSDMTGHTLSVDEAIEEVWGLIDGSADESNAPNSSEHS